MGSSAADGNGFLHGTRHRGRRLLECFAGSCRVARAWVARGGVAESFEVERDEAENLFLTANTKGIRGRIRKGRYITVWLAPNCGTWSRARRGHPSGRGFPPAVRGDTDTNIWGLPNLSDADQAKVDLGNRCVTWVISIIRLCIASGTPVVIENPATSRMWAVPVLAKLLEAATSNIVFDACQYGAAWKKPTRLVSWGCDIGSLGLRCTTKDGVCSHSGVPHTELVGLKGPGLFWTAHASAYPWRMCREFAKIVETLQ